MNRAVIAMAVFVGAAAVGAQERPAPDFLGVPLGASEAEFAKHAAPFVCKDVPHAQRASGDRVCTYDSGAAEACAGNTKAPKGAPREKCRERIAADIEYGGAKITWGAAAFYGDKLGRVVVEMKPDDFEGVISSLQAKYGKPAHTAHPKFVTQKGSPDENTILTWVVPAGSVEASRYAGNVSRSSVTLSLDSWDEEHARRKAQQKQDVKKR